MVEITSESISADDLPRDNAYLHQLGKEHGESEWSLLKIHVRDTGPGIPPDRMDRLFQPFSQVDASITRRHGGTGLGLVISKRLVEAMGGKIWVESDQSGGCKFSFLIPYQVLSGATGKGKHR